MKKIIIIFTLLMVGCKSVDTEFNVESTAVTSNDTIAIFQIDDDLDGTYLSTRIYKLLKNNKLLDGMYNDFDYAEFKEVKGYFVIRFKEPLNKEYRQVFDRIGHSYSRNKPAHNYGVCGAKVLFGYEASVKGVHLLGKLYLRSHGDSYQYRTEPFNDDDVEKLKESFPNIPLDNAKMGLIEKYQGFRCSQTIYIY